MHQYILLVIFSLMIKISSSANVEILNSPDSLIFQNTTDILSSNDFSLFINQCLGYTTKKPNWNGFYGYKSIVKNIPKNLVIFHMPISLKTISTQTFQMNIDSNLNEQYNDIKETIKSKTNNNIKTDFINLSKQKNSKTDLYSQLESLEKYLNLMEPQNDKFAFIWFEFFSNKNGINNVEDRFSKIINHIENLYGPNTLIVSIYDENQSILERTTRQVIKVGEKSKTLNVNLAHEYETNFHSSFVTIGFASLLFILAVFVIAVSMWNIDPGRDSIIYRLTSQKIKKDQ